jgi:hypothetical protein
MLGIPRGLPRACGGDAHEWQGSPVPPSCPAQECIALQLQLQESVPIRSRGTDARAADGVVGVWQVGTGPESHTLVALEFVSHTGRQSQM